VGVGTRLEIVIKVSPVISSGNSGSEAAASDGKEKP